MLGIVVVVVILVLLQIEKASESYCTPEQDERASCFEYRSFFLRFQARSKLCLQCLYFIETPHVPLFVRKLCAQKRLHQILGELRADDARTEHEHVHVVVLHALMRASSARSSPRIW